MEGVVRMLDSVVRVPALTRVGGVEVGRGHVRVHAVVTTQPVLRVETVRPVLVAPGVGPTRAGQGVAVLNRTRAGGVGLKALNVLVHRYILSQGSDKKEGVRGFVSNDGQVSKSIDLVDKPPGARLGKPNLATSERGVEVPRLAHLAEGQSVTTLRRHDVTTDEVQSRLLPAVSLPHVTADHVNEESDEALTVAHVVVDAGVLLALAVTVLGRLKRRVE